MDQLEVERVGGLAGFGGPNARLRSRGTPSLAALSPEDRRAVDALFARGDGGSGHPDGFRYRLTRITDKGRQTIEVPEADVPEAIRASVRDELL